MPTASAPRPLPPRLADLEVRLGVPVGSLLDVDRARAEAALEDAASAIEAEAGARAATAWRQECPHAVYVIALRAARREYENPRGISYEALSEHTLSTSETSGAYLTPDEAARVRRVAGDAGVGRPRVYSIRTSSAYVE